MSVDPKNNLSMSGRLTKDPEILKDVTVKCSIAVDYAANDRTENPNTTGFFDFVFFLHDDPQSTFVRKQIESGNMKKGSSVSIAGALKQSRWVATDGNKNTNYFIECTGLTYAGGSAATEKTGQEAGSSTKTVTAPEEF